MPGGVIRRPIRRITAGVEQTVEDAIAVERALEIRIGGRPLAVTLRTPGDDADLVLGFLAGEGLIAARADVASLELGTAPCADQPDTAAVTLAGGVPMDWTRLERHFAASSACGLCGRAHLESLRAGLIPVAPSPPLPRAGLLSLASRLRSAQPGFGETGGVHAAAWCDAALAPQLVREDVGRHNAVDKVAGGLLDLGRRPAGPGVLWVSGRAGAEIVLKAARAGMPVLAAVGAPTSLAIELAESAALTLIGFLRDGRMNVYCCAERLAG